MYQEVKTIIKNENCELIELEIPDIKEKAEEIRKLGVEICKKTKVKIKLDNDGYRTIGANELRKLRVENFDEIKTEEIKKCREELEKIAVESEPVPEPEPVEKLAIEKKLIDLRGKISRSLEDNQVIEKLEKKLIELKNEPTSETPAEPAVEPTEIVSEPSIDPSTTIKPSKIKKKRVKTKRKCNC